MTGFYGDVHIQQIPRLLSLLLLGYAKCSGYKRVSVHGGDGPERGPDPVDNHVFHVGVPAATLKNQIFLRKMRIQIQLHFQCESQCGQSFTHKFEASGKDRVVVSAGVVEGSDDEGGGHEGVDGVGELGLVVREQLGGEAAQHRRHALDREAEQDRDLFVVALSLSLPSQIIFWQYNVTNLSRNTVWGGIIPAGHLSICRRRGSGVARCGSRQIP